MNNVKFSLFYKLTLILLTLLFTAPSIAKMSSKILPAEAVFSLAKKAVSESFCQDNDPVRSCALISKELCQYQVHLASEECEKEANFQWIPEDKIPLISSEFGPCVTRKFVVQNKTKWLQGTKCESWIKKRGSEGTKWLETPTHAELRVKTPVGKFLSLESKFALKVANDLERIQFFANLFLKEPKRFCLSYTKSDYGTCAKIALTSIEINSAAQLLPITTLALAALKKDIEIGFPQSIASLMAADNILTVFERVKIRAFHLENFKSTNKDDVTAIALLKINEEKLLADFSSKTLNNISKMLEKASSNRDPASYDSWKSSKLKDLKQRLNAVKIHKWKL